MDPHDQDPDRRPPSFPQRGRQELACRDEGVRSRGGDVAEGDRSFFRPGELLLNTAATRRFRAELDRLKGISDSDFERRARAAKLDLHLVRLPREIDVLDLVAWLRQFPPEDQRSREVVGANFCLRGEPKYSGGPGDDPSPAKEVPFEETERKPSRDEPVDLAVLDTGVVDRLPSSLLDRLRPDQDDDDVLDVDGDGLLETQNGHGSFVAGVVHRVAPEVLMDPGRVLDSTGIGDDASITLELAETTAPVLNLSLGGYTEDDLGPVGLVEVVRRLRLSRVLVAAAGNNHSDRPFWPAAFKGVLAVAAYDSRQGSVRPAPFSNHGQWVDVCAPGVGIVSTFAHFPAGPLGVPPAFTGWARWSGTSFAAPHVAALIARDVKAGATAAAAVASLLAERCTYIPEMADYGLVLTDPLDLTG